MLGGFLKNPLTILTFPANFEDSVCLLLEAERRFRTNMIKYGPKLTVSLKASQVYKQRVCVCANPARTTLLILRQVGQSRRSRQTRMEPYRQRKGGMGERREEERKGKTGGCVYVPQFWWETCPLCLEISSHFYGVEKEGHAPRRIWYENNCAPLRQARLGGWKCHLYVWMCKQIYCVRLRESPRAHAHILTTNRLVPDVSPCEAAGWILGGFRDCLHSTKINGFILAGRPSNVS